MLLLLLLLMLMLLMLLLLMSVTVNSLCWIEVVVTYSSYNIDVLMMLIRAEASIGTHTSSSVESSLGHIVKGTTLKRSGPLWSDAPPSCCNITWRRPPGGLVQNDIQGQHWGMPAGARRAAST
mmetsp:Transcript_15314/g.33037  ORF Transcript_15314/g.33037 Transcript_15314/m.33037 type:complete len:123 (-) Transcript_15314:160-528(-)